MISYCTQCGATLSAEAAACSACGLDGGSPPPSLQPPATQWGIGAAGLGIMALVPTALLVSSLALLVPLPVATVVSAALLGAFQLALVWLLALRAWPVPWTALGLLTPRLPLLRAALLTLAAFLCSLGFTYLYTTAVNALGWDALMPPELPGELLLPGELAVFSVLALAVWTPIAEEVFFRGFVLRGLANRWKFPAALVVSAALFSALHVSVALLLPVFVTGLLLGGLYWYTRSLWPCIAIHAAQNLVATLAVIFAL